MRIVILTPLPFWHPGTKELIFRLKQSGLTVLVLDIWNLKSIDNDVIRYLSPIKASGLIQKAINRLYRKKIINTIIQDHDIIDIHWCEPEYSNFLTIFRRKNVKIISTVFGSDFYRIGIKKAHLLKKLFLHSDRVLIGKNMKNDILEFAPDLQNKLIFNQYGSSILEIISQNLERVQEFRNQWGISSDDVVITLGYNAKKEQQHIIFLDILRTIPEEISKKIILIVPLTYGREEHPDYYNTLLAELKKTITRKTIILDKRLSEIEIAETRIISDITVNLQTSDALSSSVKEAIASQNILITGKWLPYDIYEEMGIFFHRTDISGLKGLFLHTMSELKNEKYHCKKNSEIIHRFASWSSVMPQFIETYNQLTDEWN